MTETVDSRDHRLAQNEQNEADAFDRLAKQFDKTALRTSDSTFLRYRKATCGEPMFNAYPDAVFVFIGKHFLRTEDQRKPLRGLRILDLGAGDGSWSVILAEQGAQVTSIEISPMQVALARERMQIHDLSWDARVGTAYDLQNVFLANSFDLVFGQAILHHLTLDLRRVYAGVSFVLTEGGYAVFSEPLAGSRFLRTIRERIAWMIPLNRESPDERPLNREEIELLPTFFSHVDLDYSDLLAKFARRIFHSPDLTRSFSRFDRRLLNKKGWSRLAGEVFIGVRK